MKNILFLLLMVAGPLMALNPLTPTQRENNGSIRGDNYTVVYTEADLGIALPLTITTAQFLTFTVATGQFTRATLFIEVQLTATAGAGTFGIGMLPMDTTSTVLVSSAHNATATAYTLAYAPALTNGTHGINEIALTIFGYPDGTTSGAGELYADGSNAGTDGTGTRRDVFALSAPYLRFYVMNKETNTLGFAYYIRRIRLAMKAR